MASWMVGVWAFLMVVVKVVVKVENWADWTVD
jgi:hypothetical protein